VSFYLINICERLRVIFFLVLDPRITYEGVKEDYASDIDLSTYLESAKQSLQDYYQINYANRNTTSTTTAAAPTASSSSSTEPASTVDFVARYKVSRVYINELEEYFKIPREDFNSCDPIKWWVSRRAQFPNVYMLACDVLSIPGEFFFFSVSFCNLNCLVMLGSAVAVERIFSGGRDTISLRRAGLRPSTIRTLMILKHHLRLKRKHMDGVRN
jgi:hypothetical protein